MPVSFIKMPDSIVGCFCSSLQPVNTFNQPTKGRIGYKRKQCHLLAKRWIILLAGGVFYHKNATQTFA